MKAGHWRLLGHIRVKWDAKSFPYTYIFKALHAHVPMHVHMGTGAYGGHKKAFDPLESQVVGSQPVWMRTEFMPSERTANALNH